MKDTMKWLLYSPLIILHICCFYCSSNKMIIKADIDRWKLFRPQPVLFAYGDCQGITETAFA